MMKLLGACTVIFLLVNMGRSWVDYTIIATDEKILYLNSRWMANFSIGLFKFNQTTTVLSLNITALRTLDNMKYKSRIAEVLGSGYREQNVFEFTENLCDYFKNPTKPSALHYLYPLFLRYGNFPKSCILPRGNYYVKDLIIDDEVLPPYIPGDKWRLNLTVFNNNVTLCKATITYIIDRTKKLRESVMRKHG